jgi:hypothetical protein
MPRVLRCGWLFGGLMLGLACGTEQPTAPSAVPVPPTIAQPPQPPPQPLSSGERVATYVFSGPLEYAISGFTSGSQ